LQWNVRIDQYWDHDRLYGNYYRMIHNDQNPSIRTEWIRRAITIRILCRSTKRTPSPHLLNEAMFGLLRVEGIADQTGPFSVPVINVQGQGAGLGWDSRKATSSSHNYRWRDVLTSCMGRIP